MKKITMILSVCLLVFTAASCSKKKKQPQERTFPIKSAKATKKDALIFIDTIGHVRSLASIKIKSRIEGELIEVYFKEGQEVQEGDLLFSIDPRPYIAQLERTKGELKENVANLQLARDKVSRYSALVKEEYISELDFDSLTTDVLRYEALIDQNKADIEKAQINLDYCQIYSPINGVTGILQIDKGNLIAQEGNVPLIRLDQITPIYVDFSIAEKDFPKVQHYSKIHSLQIRAAYDDIEHHYKEGDLQLYDSYVDMQTGMIKLRAIFKNTDKELWPGEYVKTRVILTTQKDAVIIPYQSVQLTTAGPVVFIVQKDQTVKMQKIKLGQREDENVIVNEGIKENDEIVTDGQLNLYDDAKIFYSQTPSDGDQS